MSYIGKNPEADSLKLKGSATVPSGTAVEGQVYYNTGTGTISEGLKVYKNDNFVGIDKQLGDADTLSLSKAMDLSGLQWKVAINSTSTTVGMNSPVPQYNATSTGFANGSSTFSNSSTGNALLTNDSADIVFAYESHTVNSKNDYFGIQLDIPKAFRGGNLVLEFEYRTAEASGASSNNDFLVSIQDNTNKAQTTNSTTTGSQAAGTSVAVASSTGFAVGDKVRVESGTAASGNQANSFTEAYVTAIADSTHLTFSEDIVFPASGTSGIIASGWLIDENSGLLVEADSDTNKVGKKYSVQFKTEEDTAVINVSIQNRSTTTAGIDIFLDNILLSANKFLQASSQTKTEFYFIDGSATDVWDASGTGDHFTWDVSLIEVGFNSPAVSDSKLVSFGDITGPGTYGTVTAVTAKQNIILDVGFTAYSNNSGECKIIDSSGNNLAASYAPNSSAAGFENTNATINLAKDDYIFFNNHDNGSRIGMFTFSATPQTSDVILLESQDEIFTGWNEFTPVCGLTGGTKSLNKGFWRRVGSEMEVKISVAWSSKFTGGAATFDLPSGYSIDTGVIPTPLASLETDFGHAVVWDDSAGIPAEGRVTYSDTNTVKATWLNQTMTTYAAVINPGGTLAGQGGGWISTVSGGSGAYTITFSTGFFSVAPSIQVTCTSGTHARIGQAGSVNTSTAVFYTINASTGTQTQNDISTIHVTATRQANDYDINEYVSGGGVVGTGLPFTIADNDAVNVEFKVPIAGWNANFNPLLSLPLVKIGSDVETWGRNNFGGYASSYAPYLTGTDQNFDNTGNIISVVNTSTEGIKITALVDCYLNCNTRFQFSTANSGHAGWVKNNAIESITSVDKDKFIGALGYVGSTLAQNVGITLPVINEPLKAGDYVRLLTDGDTFNTADANPRLLINAVRDRTNTNMAHIIKPAVAIIQDQKASNTASGEAATGSWGTRDLTVIKGESWFVTLDTNKFTLEPGTYEIFATAPFYKCEEIQLRLYDVTNSVATDYGQVQYARSANYGTVTTNLMAFKTVTASTEYRLEYRVGSTMATNGLGAGNNSWGGVMVYAQVKIRKLK